jgi:glycosyltransferase involved in cell wall biosynthesis
LTSAPRIAPPPEARYRINVIQQNADMMRAFVRAYGEEVFHGAYNIPFWFWELPSMLPDWFPYYDYADEIWVASEFCRRSISSITQLPVVRMPLVIEGLDQRLAYGCEHFSLPSSTFLFGYAYDVNSYLDRKNPIALIEAFRREFGESTEVLLVLKQSYGGSTKNPAADGVREAIAGAPNIRILDGDFNDREITSFQNGLDCFVSPHRAEGFGFNLAESMYLQKPVIATGYSGNVDFMNAGNSYLLKYRLVPIKHTAGPYRKGAMWADPDVDHLRSLMRHVFEDRTDGERKGVAAGETIRKNYSSLEAGRRMQARFEELGVNQPRVQRSLFSQHSMRRTPPFVHPATPANVRQQIAAMPDKPLLSVLLQVEDDELAQCIESVRSQWYPYWELCLVTPSECCRGIDPRIKIAAEGTPIELSTGEYLVVLTEAIAPDVLFRLAKDGINGRDRETLSGNVRVIRK